MFTDFPNMPKGWAVCVMHDCMHVGRDQHYSIGKVSVFYQRSAMVVALPVGWGDSCKSSHASRSFFIA